jgi:hypothetical protein
MYQLVKKFLTKQSEIKEKKKQESDCASLLSDFSRIMTIDHNESEDDNDKLDVSDIQVRRDGQIINFG